MLGHRLRRWPNIKPALSEQIVFTGDPPYPVWGLAVPDHILFMVQDAVEKQTKGKIQPTSKAGPTEN